MAAPFIGYCILHDHHGWALGLFAYAGITDLLDGWIARKWNQGTVVGTVIDPMADKALMTVLTVTLAMKGALPGESPPPCPHTASFRKRFFFKKKRGAGGGATCNQIVACVRLSSSIKFHDDLFSSNPVNLFTSHMTQANFKPA